MPAVPPACRQPNPPEGNPYSPAAGNTQYRSNNRTYTPPVSGRGHDFCLVFRQQHPDQSPEFLDGLNLLDAPDDFRKHGRPCLEHFGQ